MFVRISSSVCNNKSETLIYYMDLRNSKHLSIVLFQFLTAFDIQLQYKETHKQPS